MPSRGGSAAAYLRCYGGDHGGPLRGTLGGVASLFSCCGQRQAPTTAAVGGGVPAPAPVRPPHLAWSPKHDC